jgi:hypothetical protein
MSEPSSQLANPQPDPQSFLMMGRKSGAETPVIARSLFPKITTSNGPQMPTPTSSPGQATIGKKRGRPSKADVERMNREAIERGDIIPPARSTQSIETPEHMLSSQMGGEAPVKKGKPRPPPKPKVYNLFNLLRVILTRRRSRSQANTKFQSMRQQAR